MGQSRASRIALGGFRRVLGFEPANGTAPADASAPAAERSLGDSALADWKRYAAELERELDDPARGAAAAPALRYEIAFAAEGVPRGEDAARFEFGLDPGPPDGPRVTVVIPVYDGLAMTVECLRSLAECPPVKASGEYILVDDASPSGVAAELGPIRGLTVLRNGENLGFLRTCNRAARLSTAEYVVFLNNDTVVRPGWLDELVETAERDPRIGIVGSKLIYPNGALQEAGSVIWSDASGWNYGRGGSADDPAYEYVRDVDYCSGAALLVRRSLWNDLGGFDERFAPAYYEDADLCFAARAAGFRVVYQPRSVVVHVEGGSGGTDLAAGPKKNQLLNQPTFRRKWSAVLEAQHVRNDRAAVERAARRLQGTRMIVIIDNYVPEPDRDAGSKRRLHLIHLLRELGWHVIFVPENDNPSVPYTPALLQSGVEVVYATPGGSPFGVRVRAALALADAVWIARPDVFLKFRKYFDEFPQLPVLYDTIDLHYVRNSRELELRADAGEGDWRKHREMKEEELGIARGVDVTIAITDVEQRSLESEGIDNVHVVPLVHEPAGRGLPYEKRAGIIFIGGYSHTPNVDAAEWLVREIMPLVWKHEPELVVTLLGSNPSARVRALAADARVVVTGYVADVAPYFDAARVFASPLRFGAGLKGKIGQALEYGLPVVTTSIGAEGFSFAPDRDALIVDDAPGFAAAILRAYRDRLLWTRLSDASVAHLAPFLPARVKERVADVLADALRRRRARKQTAAV